LILTKKGFIENTYAEAFDGFYCRVVVTADDQETVRQTAEDATATPSIVIGRVEGGVEGLLNQKETPDKRSGAILQFWGAADPKKPLSDSLKKFEIELSYRIRQDILVKPFTAVFDALPRPEGKIDVMERVGHCGDGYEWVEKRYGREVIVVPIMVPDFIIERQIGYAHGVMGANIWLMCKTREALKEAGNRALTAIHEIDGVITPFDICSAGSKTETRFPWIGPTTNHEYCPSLKNRLGATSRVPEGVNYIPELVINGTSIQAVRKAMKAGIQAASTVKNVAGISAGNYNGKLGQHKIWLRELFK
jgi:formylmethanofuran--tetrahydromethanopterin N-formyltransferase